MEPRHLATLALTAWLLAPMAASAADVTVFAASSLKTALDQIVTDWQTETGKSATISYAGTPQLAQQIAQGAPADLFISASEAWMDDLEGKALITPASRIDLIGNRLVLVAPVADATPLPLTAGAITKRLGTGKLAMALTASVPAGQYGKAALTSLGLWDTVQPQVAEAENVRVALALVSLGEAPLGVVYRSDAAAEPGVGVVAEFPGSSHPPIRYPAALVAASTAPQAAALLAYLTTPAAQARLVAAGFTPLAVAQ